MDVLRASAAALFSLAAITAQTAGTANRSATTYAGQTWVGLLVSASCSAGSQAAKQSDLTVSDRVTTPAVDAAGTRGQSQALETSNERNAKTSKNVPQTGDIHATKAKADASWTAAKRQASALDSGCRVDSGTTSFALLLPDGKMLHFDDLANAAIVKQVASGKAATVYRVQVVGKLQNGAIALDSIQM